MFRCDKIFLLRQTRVCRDKTFVSTKMILAAAPPIITAEGLGSTTVFQSAFLGGNRSNIYVCGGETGSLVTENQRTTEPKTQAGVNMCNVCK